MDRRFIYCVLIMEYRSGSKTYLLCAPNGSYEWVLDLSMCASNGR